MFALNLFSYLEMCLIKTTCELLLIETALFKCLTSSSVYLYTNFRNKLFLKASRNDSVTRRKNPVGESEEKYGLRHFRDLRSTLYIGPGRDSREVLSSTRIYLHPAVEEVNEGSRFTRPPPPSYSPETL